MKRFTDAQDDTLDQAQGIPEGSAQDMALDSARGVPESPNEIPQSGVHPAAGPVGRARHSGGISGHYAQVTHQRPNSRKAD